MLDIVKDWESELLTSLTHDAAAGLQGQSVDRQFSIFGVNIYSPSIAFKQSASTYFQKKWLHLSKQVPM
jgi:hypothetical protein